MEYGWNVAEDESFSFGSLSRELYYASLLMDEILSENVREVRRLLKVHKARADVVVPERGAAALHVLAGLEAEDFATAVTLRVLRRAGADPDVRSEEGLTPAHVAATYGRCQILEALLTNGANPSLIDYRTLLNAEEHAYKERQWQAYTMLTTYAAILQNEERYSKYLSQMDDFPSDHRSRADSSLDKCTYEIPTTDCAASKSKKIAYGKGVSNENINWDRLERSRKVMVSHDENAMDIVKSHSRNIETYQCPVGWREEESMHKFRDMPSDLDASKLSGNKVQTTKHYLEDKLPWLRSLKLQAAERRRRSKHDCIESEVNSSASIVSLDPTPRPKLSQQLRNEHDKEPIKSTLNESEMYLYGYTESSLKSNCSHEAASSSAPQQPEVDNLKRINNNMLCKMSRIFLFILKKRHTSYHQLQ